MAGIATTIGRLLLALVLGGIVGYQRELKDRPAGFRTHIMVCVGSTLFMLVSSFNPQSSADPTRIGAGVVTGIGFLGAGTIIRQGNVVVGLTTAASLWSVAAVGLAVGAGHYSAALAGTAIIFTALTLLKRLENRMTGLREHRLMEVTAEDRSGLPEEIEREVASAVNSVETIEIRRERRGEVVLRLSVEYPREVPSSTVLNRVSLLDGVISSAWET